jgi:hypothetical protein
MFNCPVCKGKGYVEYETGVEHDGVKEKTNNACSCLENKINLMKYFEEFEIKLGNDEVLNFIEIFKGIDKTTRELMEEIYMQGDCGRFHVILNSVFPEAKPYVFKGDYFRHVLSKIGDKYYDIKGIATLDRFKDIEGYEFTRDAKNLEEVIREVTLVELLEEDMFNNYSFEFRGPIL